MEGATTMTTYCAGGAAGRGQADGQEGKQGSGWTVGAGACGASDGMAGGYKACVRVDA